MAEKLNLEQLRSGGGTLWEITNRLINAVEDAGGSDADLRKLLSSNELCASIAQSLVHDNIPSLVGARLAEDVRHAGGSLEDLKQVLSMFPFDVLNTLLTRLIVRRDPHVLVDVRNLVLPVDDKGLGLRELIDSVGFTRMKGRATFLDVGTRHRPGSRLVRVADIGPTPDGTYSQVFGAKLELLRKKRLRLASLHHYFAYAAKYRSIAQQIGPEYPHQELSIIMYASKSMEDFTLRWEPANDLHRRACEENLCLVYVD